jgi:signal transduction histidine kinase
MARLRLGPLGLRLAAAFLAVAAIALAVLSTLTLLAAQGQVSDLVAQQQRDRSSQIATTLAAAYRATGGWNGADLTGAVALAAAADANLRILDAQGTTVSMPLTQMQDLMSRMHGSASGMSGMMGGATPSGAPTTSTRVVVDGVPVGTVELWFPAAIPQTESGVRDALSRSVVTASALAAAVALVAAYFVARRITRPMVELTAAARELERGTREVTVAADAPGEIGELSATFNRMASSLAREDGLRRALVADVAHELRTPLTILRGESEQLVDGLVEPTPERLASLHDEVLRLGRVVEDLESLSAAESAALRLERTPVDVAGVVRDAVRRLEQRFAEAGLALATDASPATVEGDRARLDQVVANLLTNALKYTPRGGHVRVAAGPRGSLAVIEVQDDGPGIDPDDLPHVFERFRRGRDTGRISGTGVGLAVVAELVRAHQGRVDASNVAGGGALFRVLLPRA